MARPTNRAETDAVTSDVLTLSEAVVTYLRLKGQGKSKTFRRAAERSCGYVIDACGDKSLAEYTKRDANAFRDALVEKGLVGSSITRIFGTVRAVINFAMSEEGLSIKNPFANVYYDREAGVSGRVTISDADLRVVQRNCMDAGDELRWLVALLSDTAMRLAEAAGLLREDIEVHADGQLVVHIRPHPWRRLKTKGSERRVPLFGAAAWAARCILDEKADSGFAFPSYNKGEVTNANSASAALNKWLKPIVAEGTTMHSFRHAMRDRLRAVECPADIVDQIGGWQTEGVGHSYGDGYPIEVLSRWMSAAVE
ncbi:tyrosine-type recombinase/integrase [Salipiger pacificus]|uniref:Tyrosine-type recombinase/integrase n=1 Tax=Salipiger mangrovisoli TaxID=2865933 RepID=A0ABR9XC69_9RHOB|nr:tyrosine-type recombinase/integrase [Salipiger mangrovisoli]